MLVTTPMIKRLVAEQLKDNEEYKKIKAKRERQARSNKLRRSIIGQDLSALAKGVVEGILPIVLNCFGDDVLREGTDLQALIKKLRKDIYERVLATISDLEQARKGKYRDLSD